MKMSRRSFIKLMAISAISLEAGFEIMEPPPPPSPSMAERIVKACSDYIVMDPVESFIWNFLKFDHKLKKMIFITKITEKLIKKVKEMFA